MTPTDLADRLRHLIAEARNAGMSDEAIAEALEDVARALREGVT